MEFMGLAFHPRMKELFEGYDPVRYGNFRCQICHGEDMEARGFAMPASLRALPANDAAAAARARDARATDFMVARVLPATAELLGGDDRSTLSGSACSSCHPVE
jgi:hypothetical protein